MLVSDLKMWFLLGIVPWDHFKNPFWKSQAKYVHMFYKLNSKTGVVLLKILFVVVLFSGFFSPLPNFLIFLKMIIK